MMEVAATIFEKSLDFKYKVSGIENVKGFIFRSSQISGQLQQHHFLVSNEDDKRLWWPVA